MDSYLGIDIGTSGCKAIVVDESGRLLSISHREYNIISKNEGWAELDTDEVIAKCFELIEECAKQVLPQTITGIGISSQGEAFSLIDREGNSLTNAYVSSDTRAKEYAENWAREFGEEKLYHITGHTPHPLFSLFKILWVKGHKPEVWRKAYKILCFEDLLQYRLGIQNPAMGWSLAGRTMLFDVVNHCWSREILDAIGLKEDQLARVMPSGSLIGYVDKSIAKNLSLSEHTLIAVGGHDQPCCALGAGVVKEGMAVYSSGTVECITPAFNKPIFSDSLRKSNLNTIDHVVEGMYSSLAYTLTGGNLLKWFRDEFGAAEILEAEKKNLNPYDLLLDQMPEEPTKLLVLPYFTATGTPYFDTSVKGAIIGLDLSTTRGDIVKALLEGVGMEMRLNLEILKKSGYEVKELRVIGGGANSRLWVQLKANVLGIPMTILDCSEAGCMGAAILARAAHTNQAITDISESWVKPVEKIMPDPEKNYDEKFSLYKKLYPSLKNTFF